jgi:hypothetical protein
MNAHYRLFSGLALLCVAGFILLESGCGGSSGTTSSNNSLEFQQSNLTINAASGGSISMSFWVLGCSVIVDTEGLTYKDSTSEPNCYNAPGSQIKSWSSGTGFAHTPVGFVIGLQTDPVPPQGSQAITGILVEQDSSGNYYVFDYTGTAYATSQTISGTLTCDTTQSTKVAGEAVCNGQQFDFSGNVVPTL